MSLIGIQSRLKNIEGKLFLDKWRQNTLWIQYKGTDDDINHNKQYHFKYKDKELIYDNMQDFYNEYNVYPNKDINPIIITVVDNSHLESVLYNADLV